MENSWQNSTLILNQQMILGLAIALNLWNFGLLTGVDLTLAQTKLSQSKGANLVLPQSIAQSNNGCFLRGANGKITDLGALCGTGKSDRSALQGASGVFYSPIKRRKGKTPVIDVTFESANGRQTFEMILDTGASGTVITLPMAQSMGISQVGEARVNTASERGARVAIGYVSGIEVANITAKNVFVAIQPALDIGLLGHDFFGELEITVKRNVVEFRIPK